MWNAKELQDAMGRIRALELPDGTWAQGTPAEADMDVLVTAYQDRGRRFGPARAALVREATALLVQVCVPEARKAIVKNHRGRYVPEWMRRHPEDLAHECVALTLSAADKYRVTGQGKFTSFLSQAGASKEAARLAAAAYGSPVTLDRNSAKVKAALGRIREEYLDTHMQPPAEDELAALVVESFMEEQRARMRKAAPGLRGRKLDSEARAALVKTGVWRALGEIPALRLLDRSVMLDEPVGEDGATRGSLLPDSPAGEQGSESTLDLVYRVALGANQWARAAFAARCGVLEEVEGSGALGDLPRRRHSLAGLAEAVGAERSQLRHVLDHGTSRLAAPHAQWAYLAAGIAATKARQVRKVGGIPAGMFADR